ncbi:hypothetical protein [Amycolatopsis lexingtonensis]
MDEQNFVSRVEGQDAGADPQGGSPATVIRWVPWRLAAWWQPGTSTVG